VRVRLAFEPRGGDTAVGEAERGLRRLHLECAALEAALDAGMIAVDFRREGAYVMARTS